MKTAKKLIDRIKYLSRCPKCHENDTRKYIISNPVKPNGIEVMLFCRRCKKHLPAKTFKDAINETP